MIDCVRFNDGMIVSDAMNMFQANNIKNSTRVAPESMR